MPSELARARKTPFAEIPISAFLDELKNLLAHGHPECTAQSDRNPGDSMPLASFLRALHSICLIPNYNLRNLRVIAADPFVPPYVCNFLDPKGNTHLTPRMITAVDLSSFYADCVDAIWIKQFLTRFRIDPGDFYRHGNSNLGGP
jgi:hypothetical protein